MRSRETAMTVFAKSWRRVILQADRNARGGDGGIR
jgi:hypothetical protein